LLGTPLAGFFTLAEVLPALAGATFFPAFPAGFFGTGRLVVVAAGFLAFFAGDFRGAALVGFLGTRFVAFLAAVDAAPFLAAERFPAARLVADFLDAAAFWAAGMESSRSGHVGGTGTAGRAGESAGY
jgi:hypothetical protein